MEVVRSEFVSFVALVPVERIQLCCTDSNSHSDAVLNVLIGKIRLCHVYSRRRHYSGRLYDIRGGSNWRSAGHMWCSGRLGFDLIAAARALDSAPETSQVADTLDKQRTDRRLERTAVQINACANYLGGCKRDMGLSKTMEGWWGQLELKEGLGRNS